MEKPRRKNPVGERGRGGERGGSGKTPPGKTRGGRGESLLWKNRMVSGQDFGGVGVKTPSKKLHRLEDGLSSLVGGKQTPRKRGSLLSFGLSKS